jgi:hypothetical protein
MCIKKRKKKNSIDPKNHNFFFRLDNGSIVGDSQALLGEGSGITVLSTEKVYELGRLSTFEYEKMRRIELSLAYSCIIKNEASLSECSTANPLEMKYELELTRMKKEFAIHSPNKVMPKICPPDWRARCKDIVDCCLSSIGKDKKFFEKPSDPKIYPNYCQNQYNPFDMGTIRDTLVGAGKLKCGTYSNHVNFYRDMLLFWKNCKKWKYLKKMVKKSGRIGAKVFRREWDRLFVRLETRSKDIDFNYVFIKTNFSKNKSKPHSNRTKKGVVKNVNMLITKEDKKIKSRKTIKNRKNRNDSAISMVSDFSKQDSTKSDDHNEGIASLVKTLTIIAHDVDSEGYKKMLEIIKEGEKIRLDERGQIEVDFAELDLVSLRKLQALARELALC